MYTPVIGLEVHIQLATKTKMFCGCPIRDVGAEPNSSTCPVCLGLPGSLPVPNKKALEYALKIALALRCKVNLASKFDRKNYFYPDLPKGYQISQYDTPLGTNGRWSALGGANGGSIRIRRVHLEEDTGKLVHAGGESLVDFNRSGVPLLEIVTEPDFSSKEEVLQFLKDLQLLVKFIDVSGADMEKGSMRLEANVSLQDKKSKIKKEGESNTGAYKVELKNINSFRFLGKALDYEINRQKELMDKGEILVSETRGYNEKLGKTEAQRTKEEAADYRYFPEPDIPPIYFTDKDVERIKNSLPELPYQKRERFKKEYGLADQYITVLTESRESAQYFEESVRIGGKSSISPKKIADVLVNKKVGLGEISPEKLIEVMKAKKKRIEPAGEELEKLVDRAVRESPKAVEDYKKGKRASLNFLVGQIMRKTGGKYDPNLIRDKIEKHLSR